MEIALLFVHKTGGSILNIAGLFFVESHGARTIPRGVLQASIVFSNVRIIGP
jgi:hypothetical protein